MNRIPSPRISGWLIRVSYLLLVCDALLLPLAPLFAYLRFAGPGDVSVAGLLGTFQYDFDDGLGNVLTIILRSAWQDAPTAVLALFLILFGLCGACILLQGIHILESIVDGAPFSARNSLSLRRAAAASRFPSGFPAAGTRSGR